MRLNRITKRKRSSQHFALSVFDWMLTEVENPPSFSVLASLYLRETVLLWTAVTPLGIPVNLFAYSSHKWFLTTNATPTQIVGYFSIKAESLRSNKILS